VLPSRRLLSDPPFDMQRRKSPLTGSPSVTLFHLVHITPKSKSVFGENALTGLFLSQELLEALPWCRKLLRHNALA